MSRLIDSSEAATLLGVTRQTLYSYVSRGLLRAQSATHGSGKRYLRSEVERLARRAQQGRKPRAAAGSTLDFGLPVLESALTLIADGELWYRGQRAVALAAQATLEELACLFWSCRGEVFDDVPAGESLVPGLPDSRSENPLEAAMQRFTSLASQLAQPARTADAATHHAHCAQLLRAMAAALLGSDLSCEPLHLQCARAWQVDAAAAERIRAALILCADHELNASSFTVRCVASTGASLHMALCAGLAALSGPRHGVASERVETLLDSLMMQSVPTHIDALLAARPAGAIPGFGHRLYPAGDPRAAFMLRGLPDAPVLSELCEYVEQRCADRPNLDFGLVVLRRALGLPRGAASLIFCLGRTVGWLAHALEQRDQGALIRPRAHYTGRLPEARRPTPQNVRVLRMGR
ncbi:citrate synthase family protein [Viridibacterium curvum]|uniref:citrate synthase (unknown stereospecificity) n=1 Tax=Viridibacterium curvum TaxID=1101404 RepID=A0ABP9QQ91_9RHOO